MLMPPLRRRSAVRAAHPEPARQPMTDIEFCAWVATAEPGARIEYHRGFLVVDIVPVISRLPEPERRALKAVAAQAWRMAELDLVHLVQHRHGPGDYSYLAISRPRREGALPDFASLTITEEAA